MISTLFEFGNEIIEVRINNITCLFKTKSNSGVYATIDSIKLSKEGCIKEFPDLKNNNDWKKEAIKRFKEKIKNLPTEKERMKYVINDLKNHGYKAVLFHQSGYRPIKIKT